ncbi:hypothetical protein RP726_20825 [Candidatus Methylospira mobilis]|uniref:hypothetical protein n=1 Tax=Candidatus Methylospira mobilis TaxID=1808979 RepID=UPI0028E3642B|nr:hypothetical protein [Candidatus Methylospira mobilis]WNV04805.1 hypothetical protein RP726_20825 [Candidatus Methylospira mobilis]
MKALFAGTRRASHAQALWRFPSNKQGTPLSLARPLPALSQQNVETECDAHALCVHDGSRINYNTHTIRKDRKQPTHGTDVGYELQSTLLASDQSGAPLAAPVQNGVTDEGVWQTRVPD